ncbi:uncharacterized protein IUM83_01982 [Phytophthora cinnamomi]|uniref:uncharacterized protein n=1 Tax=Phytophthora cinnamomi TaxID=4785 RepID=UPI0035599E5B|nr:hypothetical protein IUM83_01982 [Phytophthora cinnamomi]
MASVFDSTRRTRWCSKLSGLGLVTYKATVAERLLWHPKQRVLVPDRPGGFFEDPGDFYDGGNWIQLIRETLALLAAVEHIDHVAWRFLLEEHCEVPLDEEGFEIFEDKIAVRFELIQDSRVERDLMTAQNLNRHKVIAYQALNIFCGLSQRERVSQAYVTYLSRIAAMGAQPELALEFCEPALYSADRGFWWKWIEKLVLLLLIHGV